MNTPENQPAFDAKQASVLRWLRALTGIGMALVAAAPVAAMLFMGREAVKAGLEKEPSPGQASANRAAIAVFVVAVLLGWGMRMQAYKAQWQVDAVTPRGYANGITRYVLAVVAGHWAATVIGVWVGYPPASLMLAPAAIFLLFFGFPNGKPMLSQPPELGKK